MVEWQFSIHFIPIVIGLFGSGVLGGITWRYRDYPYASSLLVFLFAVVSWSVLYLIGLGTSLPEIRRLAYSLIYPATGLASIAWFDFVARYTGKRRYPTGQKLLALGVVPAAMAVVSFTDKYHNFPWASAGFMSGGQVGTGQTAAGVLFLIHLLQSYSLVVSGAVLIIISAVRSENAHRSETAVLAVAAIVPPVVNLLYITGIIHSIDLTPAAFTLTGTVFVATAFRDQLLQTLPLAREIARDELVKQMSSPVIVVDRRARIIDINPAAATLVDTATDVVGSDVGAAFPEVAEAVSLDDRSRQRVDITKTNDESQQHYEIEKLPLHRGGGTIRGHLLLMHDVTELKTNQAELMEERRFIDKSLDTLDDVFYMINTEGELTRWNERLINITGYDDSQLEGMDAVNLFPEGTDRERIANGIQRGLRGAGDDAVEADLLTADNRRIPHEFTGARLEDTNGDLIGLVGIGRDIMERKERERRLRTFREAVENAGRMIYWMDKHGTVEYVNPALEAQLKCEASELIGKSKFPLVNRAEAESVADNMLETLTRGETWQSELTLQRDDGEQRTVTQTVKPVYDGEVIERLIGVAGDVTQKRRQEQQLSVLQRILRHDLRNNLNVMLLSIQIAQREATEESVRQQLQGAERTIEETLSLSQKVKQFQQAFESGDVEHEVVDIVDVTREQLATLRAEQTDAEFVLDISEGVHVVASGLIERAIRNVLRNAVEHNDADAIKIDITLHRRPEEGEVELRIADNGPGIPDETIEVLNADQEEQMKHLSGFGLWAVQWVLTLSGGRLEFAENGPRGTVAKLVLPAAQTENQRRATH